MPGTVTSCPPPPSMDLPPTPPPPEALAYSLTLPAAPQSPAIARITTRTVLRAHGLEDLTDAALMVVSELAACACRFTDAAEVYVSLRYRDAALRVILYDGHPRHTNPHLAAACAARRRATLRVLSCVVKACAGDWGFDDAREPAGGTRLWAVLPRAGAGAYAAGSGGS
ncbi:ATP-binding protein [Streptomyces sp. NPDC050803]|uniref:ATP-binding protein n=1 Tax=unclassified Streptomyces TaxID=2593676 RepID=UPI0034417A18